MRNLILSASLLLLSACSIPVEVTVDNTCDVERFRFSKPVKTWIAGLYYPADHADPELRDKPRPGTPAELRGDLNRLGKQGLVIDENCGKPQAVLTPNR